MCGGAELTRNETNWFAWTRLKLVLVRVTCENVSKPEKTTRRAILNRKELIMRIQLKKAPSQPNFDAPEGNFQAELVSVGPYEQQTAAGMTDCVRFVFQIQVPERHNQIIMAGKNIDPDSPKLQRFLARWLGEDFISSSGDSFDPETLVGKKAELTIKHIPNPGYERPYCNVVSAHPPGTLTLTQAFKQEAQDI